jgi:hypothetical protein
MDFSAASDEWLHGVPEDSKEFEISLIRRNPGQFNPITWLEAFVNEGVTPLAYLTNARQDVEGGRPLRIGEVTVDELPSRHSLAKLDIADRQKFRRWVLVAERLEEFQKETATKLFPLPYQYADQSSRQQVPPSLFDGMKLKQGVEFAKKAGELYFGLQLELLDLDLSEERDKRPKWKVGGVRFATLANRVPVCDVCANLMKELHPVTYDDWDDDQPSHGDDELESVDDFGGPENR